jgi:hypothetical protein
MDAATLFVILTLLSGEQRTVVRQEFLSEATCAQEAARLRSIWQRGVRHAEVFCARRKRLGRDGEPATEAGKVAGYERN